MRKIQRDIVGGILFSKDKHVLLGQNGSTGVYPDMWTIPGGGVEVGETLEQALWREMMEEVGIDIRGFKISIYPSGTGQSTKTLKETGETVEVDMTFHNYRVDVPTTAEMTPILLNDYDLYQVKWIPLSELAHLKLTPPLKKILIEVGVLEP